MKDICTILKKELWYFKYSLKGLIIIFLMVVVGYPLLCFISSKGSSLGGGIMPQGAWITFCTLIAPFGISSQISSKSISQEKNEKTLEILLASNVKKFHIIIGKTSLGILIGSLVFLISICIFKIVTTYSSDFNMITLNIFFILNGILMSYLGSSSTIFTTLLCNDENQSTFITGITLIVVILLISMTRYYFNINDFFYLLIIFTLCLLVSYINSILLSKKSSLITKL